MSTSVAMILKVKGSAVHTAGGQDTLSEISRILTERGIGAVVVVNAAGAPVGVLSERDIVRAIAAYGPEVLTRESNEFMSRDIITCSEKDSVDAVMALMTEERIRHVPVLKGGVLCGIISIGDVVKTKIAEAEAEAAALKAYIAAS